jgi:hypothetical protein
MASGTGEFLAGVWVSQGKGVYAVGRNGTLLYRSQR